MRLFLPIAGLLALLAGAFYLGTLFRPAAPPQRAVTSLGPPVPENFGRLKAFPGKREVRCPEQTRRTFVAVIIGQSNAANTGGQRFDSTDARTVNYAFGKCYQASDPLLGSNSDMGSVWIPFAERLLRSGRYDRVVLVPVAVGGTSIAQWRQGGALNAELQDTLRALKDSEYEATHFLWHQGEADKDAPDVYRFYSEGLASLIESTKAVFPKSRFLVSVASVCHLPTTTNPELRRAQMDAVNRGKGIFQGPDTDRLTGSRYRFDDCHFSYFGQLAVAHAWSDATMAAARP